MQNRPLVEKNRHRPSVKAEPSKKGSITEFLKDTGFGPVVFVGKCIEQFGWRLVVGGLLGAISVYGYDVVKGLPYGKSVIEPVVQISQPSQPKTVQLHGRVRDGSGSPVNERFWVGVLAKQLGPVQSSDGTFSLEVPQSNSYDVALWTSETISIYNGFAAEQDGTGYKLLQALPFLSPANTALLERSKPKRREPHPQLAQAEIAAR
jgi:hypothetical protein